MLDGVEMTIFVALNIVFNLLLGLFLGYSSICGNRLNVALTYNFYDRHLNDIQLMENAFIPERRFSFSLLDIRNVKIIVVVGIVLMMLSFRLIRLVI